MNIDNVILNRICKIFMVLYTAYLLIICSVNTPKPVGEWDDYSFPIASLINDHNFSINDRDIEVYKEVFPEWVDYLDSYKISSYPSRLGNGMLTYYFPTYALICLPMLLLLKILKIPTIYVFSYTNILFLVCSLIYVYLFLNVKINKRILLIILLSINPIIFYLSWTSAEVFIFSMLVMASVSWYNGWNKRAAIFISVAGTLNPTIMSIGIIMIIEYLTRLMVNKKDYRNKHECIKEIKKLFIYGLCYIIGIIPMVYNLFHIGHISLIASRGVMQGTENAFSRFVAYLFDLNFGILPYFSIILLTGIILIVISIVKRNIRFLEWMIAFFLNILLFSLMIHINCGMSGIARYNAWASVLLIFAVAVFFDEIIHSSVIKRILSISLLFGTIVTGIIVIGYNPYLAKAVSAQKMTPIAGWVLDNIPNLYNPLYSTFNCRTNHVDGGYQFETALPIVYMDGNGYVKKILATNRNIDLLRHTFRSKNEGQEWFDKKINELSDEPQYISVPSRYTIMKANIYELGEEISFSAENDNAKDYVMNGMSYAEDWGSWTDGKKVLMRFTSKSDCGQLRGVINCYYVYNGSQDITINVNGETALDIYDFTGGELVFTFNNPGNGEIVEIELYIPEAMLLQNRELGVGIQKMTIYEIIDN